jgi:acyl dehydratase
MMAEDRRPFPIYTYLKKTYLLKTGRTEGMKALSNMGLLAALIRNINSRHLNREMIGFSLDGYEGTMERDRIMRYARATGDTNPEYLKERAIVPPFFLSGLIHEHLVHILTSRDLGLNLLRMVHGEQMGIWHRPVRSGDRLRGRLLIRDIDDTAAGEMMTVSVQGFIDNRLAAEALIRFLIRCSDTAAARQQVEDKKEPALREIFRMPITTWEGQQLAYADVSGDNNFIHTSTVLARLAGLPRTILHGVCFMAMCCASLTRQLLDDDLTRLASITGRFSGYVLPGQTLTLVGYEPSTPGEQPFAVFNPAGRTVMKRGSFTFR